MELKFVEIEVCKCPDGTKAVRVAITDSNQACLTCGTVGLRVGCVVVPVEIQSLLGRLAGEPGLKARSASARVPMTVQRTTVDGCEIRFGDTVWSLALSWCVTQFSTLGDPRRGHPSFGFVLPSSPLPGPLDDVYRVFKDCEFRVTTWQSGDIEDTVELKQWYSDRTRDEVLIVVARFSWRRF